MCGNTRLSLQVTVYRIACQYMLNFVSHRSDLMDREHPPNAPNAVGQALCVFVCTALLRPMVTVAGTDLSSHSASGAPGSSDAIAVLLV